jgi:hypothetical protein
MNLGLLHPQDIAQCVNGDASKVILVPSTSINFGLLHPKHIVQCANGDASKVILLPSTSINFSLLHPQHYCAICQWGCFN